MTAASRASLQLFWFAGLSYKRLCKSPLEIRHCASLYRLAGRRKARCQRLRLSVYPGLSPDGGDRLKRLAQVG